MATKKATYRYDNGSSWDEIMFKTTADQVVESTTKRFVSDTEKSNWNDARTKANDWNDFKTNGGIISGPLKVNEVLINTNEKYGLRYDEGSSLIMTVANAERYQFGHETIAPAWGNDLSLGYENRTWKDLWLGTFSRKPFGYTKLPNGMIEQWISYIASTEEATKGYLVFQSNYPLVFSSIMSIQVTPQTNNYDFEKISNITVATDLSDNSKIAVRYLVNSEGPWHCIFNIRVLGEI